MKRTLIVLFIVFSLPEITFGQVGIIDFREGPNGRMFIRNRNSMEITIPYDPNLYAEARLCKVELFDGSVIEGFYKYNLETESLTSEGSDLKLNINNIKRFTFMKSDEKPEEIFMNINLLWPKSEYGGFFKNVVGTDLLFMKHYLEFKPRDYDPVMDVGNEYDRVEMETDFYAQLNSEWKIIPQRKKDFTNLFSEYIPASYLKKFMKQNKIKTDNAEDIGKVLNWMVTIKSEK